MAVSRENPETLCLYPVQIDTAHLSPEAPKNNGIFGSSCSVNRTAVEMEHSFSFPKTAMARQIAIRLNEECEKVESGKSARQ